MTINDLNDIRVRLSKRFINSDQLSEADKDLTTLLAAYDQLYRFLDKYQGKGTHSPYRNMPAEEWKMIKLERGNGN